MIADLEARGTYMVGNERRPDWLVVARIDDPTAASYLVATVRFSAKPAGHGIKGGRISSLAISRHYRTNCVDLFLGYRATPTEFFVFVSGVVGTNYLEHHRDAQDFYDALLGIMN